VAADLSADNGDAMLPRPWSKRLAGQRGTALIEFALVLPILVVLTFLVVDFGRAFYVKNLLDQAAREGARQLAVGNDDARATHITRFVAGTSGLDTTTSALTVTPLNPDASGANQVRMTVSTTFHWLYPGLLSSLGLAQSNPSLTGTCAMRREY
jgi:Flp pilus assembly protein TadG